MRLPIWIGFDTSMWVITTSSFGSRIIYICSVRTARRSPLTSACSTHSLPSYLTFDPLILTLKLGESLHGSRLLDHEVWIDCMASSARLSILYRLYIFSIIFVCVLAAWCTCLMSSSNRRRHEQHDQFLLEPWGKPWLCAAVGVHPCGECLLNPSK